ncbi:hypothetical protein ACVR1G_02185 [Streptococcus dentasini]
MKKKMVLAILLGAVLLLMAGCGIKRADFKGKWHTQNEAGEKSVMVVKNRTISIAGTTVDYKYTGRGNNNGSRYITFESEGRSFTVFFPEKDNKTAILLHTDGKEELKGDVYLVMSKSERPDYDQYIQKYMTLAEDK